MVVDRSLHSDGLHGRQIRRNSVIQVRTGPNGPFVEKRYHSKFSVRQEREAYHAVDRLLNTVAGFRRPRILQVNESRNTICLEYINGANLMECFLRAGTSAFADHRDRLVCLFAGARKLGLRFDSDPANFVVDGENGGLVLVDPLCEGPDLSDFAMVVFLWGLLKSFIRSLDWRQLYAFRQCWMGYYTAYLKATGTEYGDLNRQLSDYIGVVIGWNVHESEGETRWVRLTRRLVVAPTWRVMQLVFRSGLVRP